MDSVLGLAGDPLSNRPLLTIGSNCKYEILYNLGVSLLHARKASEAFDCLMDAVQLHHRDPLLWLRLAECCIQVHKPVRNRFSPTRLSVVCVSALLLLFSLLSLHEYR